MIPLEREYEGWVMRGIDDSMRETGLAHTQGAVSPIDEGTWPSDEFFLTKAKLVGLQFKRPRQRASGMYYWRLEQLQFQLIKQHKEIFYAFPNFSERMFRRGALYHTYFWHPGRSARKLILDENEIHRRSYPWGRFLRDLLACDLLEPLETRAEANRVAQNILRDLSELYSRQGTYPEEEEADMFVLMSIRPRFIS